jgi:hypothetical protein
MDDGAGGGRPAIPTFGLCRNKMIALLSIFMLLGVGMYFVDDRERNIQTLSDLLLANREVIGHTYLQDEIIAMYDYIAQRINFLMRNRGRFPGLEIYFHTFRADLHHMLYANLEPAAPLEDIFDNFRRIMGWTADHREIFTVETTRPRVVTNMRVLNDNLHHILHRTAPIGMAPPAPAAAAAAHAAPRARVRIVAPPRRDQLLESGFAYFDARRIPLSTGRCLGGPPRNPAHFTSAPGFANAFDRSLRLIISWLDYVLPMTEFLCHGF